MVPLVSQTHYNSHIHYNRTRNDDQLNGMTARALSVKLLPTCKSAEEPVPTELPVSASNVIIRYLLRCDDRERLPAQDCHETQ